MRERKPYGSLLRRILGATFLCLLLGLAYIAIISKTSPPPIADRSPLNWQRKDHGHGFYTLHNSWLRKSRSGLFEMYVEGKPFERGVVNGKISQELVQKQEDYFNDQINKMIPSKFYLHFLKYFLGFFNRNLDKQVTPEYRDEIYGVSGAASDKYDYIGSNYQRILNYHAAHDIGHALQNLALVGCTSFGTWGSRSADSTMIIGRNFDFYVGDHFAEDKIVSFVNPVEGHKFMFVTWGGFIGVVSGMNDQGLTVTINAAKSSIPFGAATPVSLVAREILQYAQNISEALAIARSRKMFVSESFLVGSAEDNKAVIIEKTPDSVEVYDPRKNFILCTNHFQSAGLGNLPANQKAIRENASEYRYQRLQELLDSAKENTVQQTIRILRDRRGLHGADIGLGNEKAVNQFIAHHSIVFEPQKGLVWVSTAPWQLGQYVCYDLKKVFGLAGMKTDQEISDSSLDVPADPFLQTDSFRRFELFMRYKKEMNDGQFVSPDSVVASNPNYYHAYVLAGNEYFKQKSFKKAIPYYEAALRKEIATRGEADDIRRRLHTCLIKSGGGQ